MFDYWDLEDTFMALLMLILSLLIFIGIFALCQDHKVRFYYLDGDSGAPVIKGDINWGDDIYIKTPQLTFKEAQELVEKLNASLPK